MEKPEADRPTTWPDFLYKYRSLRTELDLERALKVCGGEIYAAKRSEFNDPFDCEPVLDVSRSQMRMQFHTKRVVHRGSVDVPRHERRRRAKAALARLAVEGADKLSRQAMDTTLDAPGILSLSSKPNSLLMWGHYGSEHTGVCFQFGAGQGSGFRRALPVLYSPDRPVLPYPIREAGELMEAAFMTKALAWAYEEEWRMLFTDGPGVKKYETGLLKGVIFGARTSDAHSGALAAAARAANPSVRLYRATLHPRQYDVLIEPFTP